MSPAGTPKPIEACERLIGGLRTDVGGHQTPTAGPPLPEPHVTHARQGPEGFSDRAQHVSVPVYP